MRRVNAAVFVSGGGTNLQALLDADMPQCRIALVLSRKPQAYALQRARQAGVPCVCIEKTGEAFEQDALAALESAHIEMIVLAGFLTILSAHFISSFHGPIINVHPALLPAFGGRGYYGLRVHDAVLQSGVKVTGATVHLVNETPDGGRILAQKAVSVHAGDTPSSLQRRVMEEAEWILLPNVVKEMSKQMATGYTPLSEALSQTEYPGRGIVIGRSADGKRAIIVYFIMGRSENSQNRVFTETADGIRTQAFDESKVIDPSLIIYAPIRTNGLHTIVTNGDQTDTINDALTARQTFADALRTRAYEPDKPHYTPRISGMVTRNGGDAFTATLSVLRRASAEDDMCVRSFFEYDAILPGCGYYIHTYQGNGNPLPAFTGEPEAVLLPEDDVVEQAYRALNADNRVSLCVREVRLSDGQATTRIINRFE